MSSLSAPTHDYSLSIPLRPCHTWQQRTFPYLIHAVFCTSLLLTGAHLASIKEVEYARSHLAAIGTGLFSNHEGKYLGNPELTPFFAYLQSRETPFEVVFIHSSSPLLNINGTFISGNPSRCPRLTSSLSPLEVIIPLLMR